MVFKKISELPNIVGEQIKGFMEEFDKTGISIENETINKQINEGKDSIIHILGEKIEDFLSNLEK